MTTSSSKKNKKSLYVALDSDILRSLTIIEPFIINDAYYDFKNSNDPILSKYSGYLSKLFIKSINDELRLLVTPTTFYENKYKPKVLNFIKSYCYIPAQHSVLDPTYSIKKQAIKDLAYAYCGAGKPFDPTNPPPMTMKYLAEVGSCCPTNDCYIMAEATVENAILLTNNSKDFVFNKKNNEDDNSRRLGIININKSFGYVDDEGLTPCPFSIFTFGPMLKMPTENLRFALAENSSKIKADEVIKSLD